MSSSTSVMLFIAIRLVKCSLIAHIFSGRLWSIDHVVVRLMLEAEELNIWITSLHYYICSVPTDCKVMNCLSMWEGKDIRGKIRKFCGRSGKWRVIHIVQETLCVLCLLHVFKWIGMNKTKQEKYVVTCTIHLSVMKEVGVGRRNWLKII